MSEELKQQLKNRVFFLFYSLGLEDSEIRRLLEKEGTPISREALARLRYEMGLKRSIRNEEVRQAAVVTAREAIEEQLLEGIIDGYGKRMLQLHFRQRGMFFTRDLLFKEYAAINPEAVQRRLNDHQRRRGEYIVNGPNWCWSIDGHEKIKPYGIEIYACIDAYSRYVIWAYVGITAGTSLSVLHQYLYTVEESGFTPQFIRSDCGVETGQISYAHFMLSKANDPDITWEQCYMHGTSTSNQRIEAWWQQLSKGLLFRWRDYFRNMQTQNLYSKNRLADTIAVGAIYIPILRREIRAYIETHNSHRIRKQKNRPNIVVGKPSMLFMCPPDGTRDFKQPVNQEELRNLKAETPVWDMHAVLPPETQLWCDRQLKDMAFDPHTSVMKSAAERVAPYKDVYLELRRRIKEYQASSARPALGLLAHPTGGWNFAPPDNNGGYDFANDEVVDQGITEEQALQSWGQVVGGAVGT
ncbi:hypothetical protein NX059_002044 [Plenodomus lindquistii]|nr:hypothetical protein NX059_002044 [Plenodomus lindquistii]